MKKFILGILFLYPIICCAQRPDINTDEHNQSLEEQRIPYFEYHTIEK